ncbi:helix-turn-helix transcriptional regulator [Hamadaea tsunoensis]|uniref:helix-turn-helix transcriptional regulator n=1 Tax=Hamadaea tsunoensis TaxID=53368 RepID=UPI0004037433|nr:LuxR C-terminal-related transcriptional regulator [Hamadaea tsunoensis]
MATTALGWPFVGRHGELEQFGDALRDRRLDALLLTGEAGVGKSRLAQECLAFAEAAGHATVRVTATASAGAVPLSALAPLLPDDADFADPYALFEAVRRRLPVGEEGRRVVLAVDDIDLLDSVSLALLSFLLADGSVFVVATQRHERLMPDAIDSRWRDGRAVRVNLERLTRRSVETLLHFALGRPVAAAAVQALWESSQGNVLYLRELVLAGQQDGSLVDDGEVWRLTRMPSNSAGLTELVERRLGSLTAEHRAALELLALCAPLAVEDVLAYASVATLTELEAQGLIVVRADGRRQEIQLAHPLHAQTLQQSVPRLRARSMLLAQAERIEAHGARRRGDPLRLASWRLDASGTADPDLLLRAARLARFTHDLPRTERLAEAVLRNGPHPEAGLLLAEALHEQARFAEAEAVLAEAGGPGAPVPLALSRAMNLLFGLGDAGAARAALAGVAEETAGLRAVRALVANAIEGPIAVADFPGTAPDGESAETQVLWHRASAAILADSGRVVAAEAAAEQGFRLHLSTEDRTVISHPATHLLTLADALLRQGRLDDAELAATRGMDLTVTDGVEALICWFPGRLGAVALARGRVTTAERFFRETLAHARATSLRSAMPMALSGLVRALAVRNALDPEDPLLAELIALAGHITFSAEPQRAIAWAHAAGGRHTQARETLRTAAAECARRGRLNAATDLLHDALRLGDDVSAELIAACAQVQGPLAGVRAEHAVAVAARDADGLAAAGRRFAELGADLIAAEVLTVAAASYEDDGRRRSATACAAEADELLRRCQGATTPGLIAAGGRTPLSGREREIADLVLRGLTSKQIAEQLFLSVRTVSNHLQNIYTKLGVTSRAELSGIVGRREAAS